MGIINYIKNIFNKGSDENMTRKIGNIKDLNFDKKLLEFKIWYKGDPNFLMAYYKLLEHNGTAEQSFYWSQVRGSNLKRHSPIAGTICEAMADLLFSNGLIVKETSDDIAEIEKTRRNKLLEKIEKINNMASKFSSGAEFESWSGHTAYKFSVNTFISDVPIIQNYSADEFEVIKNLGMTTAIIFKEHFEEKDTLYLLNEIYGMGFIDYELFTKDKNSDKWKEVDINSTIRTFGLERINFTKKRMVEFEDENGIKSMIEIDELIPVIFAVEKPNKLPNNLFPRHWAGRSDFTGLETLFDGLDEKTNAKGDLARRGKLKRYANLDTHNVNDKGVKLGIDDFDNDVEIMGDLGKDEKQASIIMQEPNLNAIKNLQIAKTDIQIDILSRVKLSASTIGIDKAGADASGASIREREKASLRTRNAKMEIWRPKIEELYQKGLMLADIISGLFKYDDNLGLMVYHINVEFNDYVVPTLEERVKTMKEAVLGKAVDIETAVRQVWVGKSEEDIQKMIENIKLENEETPQTF